MTASDSRPPANPSAPEVLVPPQVPAAAGSAVAVPVRVLHRGAIPAHVRITVLGLDSRWAPEPLALGPLQPGEAAEVTLTLVPERGAMGARYPFVVAVEATATRGDGEPVMGVAESVLVVDSQQRISLTVQPPAPSAVFGRTIRVEITNPGSRDRDLTLHPEAARGTSVRLRHDRVRVPAQHTVSVKGKVRIRRPSVVGVDSAHALTVTARGVGAPEFVEATIRARPMFRRAPLIIVGLVLVVALWAAAAIVFIPKISDAFTPKSQARAPATVASQGPKAGATAGVLTQSGSGGSSNGGSGGSSKGGSGNGSGSGGGANGPVTTGGYQLSGTVTGPGPEGVTVTLARTSLVGAIEAGAKQSPGASEQTANAFRAGTSPALGKVPAEALRVTSSADGARTGTTSVVTGKSGEFSFAGITSPGYYLLTLAKAGFQTQRFLINSADLASPKPMKVTLVPGDGSLSGTVVDGDGNPIGAATITVTDGTVSLQTSSVSQSGQGKPGTFSVSNLSTPGSYLITATAPGFGGSSVLVDIGPSGHKTADLELTAGQASITGSVTGEGSLGHVGGLGGISVTATNGTITRSATTVTSRALRGTFILPNMPAPGKYTVTISGDGYLTQTRTMTLAADTGTATVNATLSRADGTVSGVVRGVDTDGKAQGGLVGVGLTLISSTTTLKTMSTSGGAPGEFRFTGVPPGTYVLTASQYGRIPASATIELKAAEDKSATLVLKTSTSTALPATSHIRGVVVDARSQGPLTCDRQRVPDAQKCVITVSVQKPVPGGSTGSGSKTTTISATALPKDPNYQIPAVQGDAPGLTPGLYTVTVSAPGYESATTRVQVGQNQTAQAPQVALQPLAVIAGTVTDKVGSPGTTGFRGKQVRYATCVVAAPAGGTLPAPTDLSPNPASCEVPGDGELHSVPVRADGTYQVRGLPHGHYRVEVLPRDPEYLPTSPSAVQIAVGSDARFDVALDRYGRAQVTVLQPDLQTGELSPATGQVSVAVTANGGARAPVDRRGEQQGDGTFLLTGLLSGNGSYTFAASGSHLSGAQTSHSVGLNQTVPVTVVVLPETTFAVVGQVTAQFDGLPVPAPGVTVVITGIVGYDGGAPITASATAVTDDHGQFAVIPADWQATGGPSLRGRHCLATQQDPPEPCPEVTDSDAIAHITVARDGHTVNRSLVVRKIYLSAAADSSVQGLGASATMVPTNGGRVRSLPVTALDAQPSVVPPLTLVTAQPVGGYVAPRNDATVAVTGPVGAGSVTVDVASDGSLSWQGTTLPADRAVSGHYRFTVTLPGYVPVTGYLLCPLGQACRLTDASGAPLTDSRGDPRTTVTIRQLPSISLEIFIPYSPAFSNDSVPTPRVTPESAPTTAGQITTTSHQPAQRFDDATGRLIGWTSTATFRDKTLPADGLAHPGTYRFDVSIPGYSISNNPGGRGPGTVVCGADFTIGCDTAPITLIPLPTFRASVTDATGNPLTNASINVATVPSGTGGATVTWNPNGGPNHSGAWEWDQEGLPNGLVADPADDDQYRFTATLDGYDQGPYISERSATTDRPATFACRPDRQVCTLTIVLYQRGPLAVKFVDQQGNPVPNVLAKASAGDYSTIEGVSVADGTVMFQNMKSLPDARYTIAYQPPGYRWSDTSTDPADVACGPADDPTPHRVAPRPGSATTCVVTLHPIGHIIGTVQGYDATGTGSAWRQALPGVQITATCRTPAPAAPRCITDDQFGGRSGSQGDIAVTGSNTHQGLMPGTYTIRAHKPGYRDVTGMVTVTGDFRLANATRTSSDGEFTLHDGRLAISLPVTLVTVRLVVQTQSGVALLQPGTYAISGHGEEITCTVGADGTGDPGGDTTASGNCAVPESDNEPYYPYVTLAGVIPGDDYTITASTKTGAFDVTTQQDVSIEPVTKESLRIQKETIQPFFTASTQIINLVGANGEPWTGDATVSLIDVRSHAVASNQAGDHPLSDSQQVTDADATGTFQLNGIPTGDYYILVTGPIDIDPETGAISGAAGEPVTGPPGHLPIAYPARWNASTDPAPQALRLPLTRATRSISITPTSAAAGHASPSLTGATVTIHQDQPSGDATPSDDDQTLSATGNTFTGAQVPTGTWTARISGQPGAATPGTGAGNEFSAATATFTVPDPALDVGTLTLDTSLVQDDPAIRQGGAHLTATWTVGACSASDPPLNGTATFTIVKTVQTAGGDDETVTGTVSATVDSDAGTATADVLLPPGHYRWYPIGLGSWTSSLTSTTTSKGGFTITVPEDPDPGSVTAQTPGGATLTGANGEADVELNITGSTVDDSSVHVTADGPGNDVASGTLDGWPKCLAPGSWDFQISNDAGTLLLGPQQDQRVRKGHSTTVTFTGYALPVQVSLPDVDGMPANTSATVDVAVSKGSATADPTWPVADSPPPVTVGSNGWTGLTLILPEGTYYLTATPRQGDLFAAPDPAPHVDLDETSAADPSTVLAATLTYTGTTIDVTVQDSTGTAVTELDSLTVTGGNGTTTCPNLTANGGKQFVCAGLLRATRYTVTATWTDAASAQHTASTIITSADTAGGITDVTLKDGTVGLPVTVTVDGTAYQGATVTAQQGTDTTTKTDGTTNADGTTTLYLTPNDTGGNGTPWTVSVTAPDAETDPMVLAPQTITVSRNSDPITFTGQTVTATIQQQTVKGRTADGRSVPLALCIGSTTPCTDSDAAWTDETFAITAGTTSNSIDLILSEGATYVLTATPSDGIFSAGSTSVTPAEGTVTASVTLDYARAVVTATLPEGSTADVTLAAGGSTIDSRTGVDGSVTFFDVVPDQDGTFAVAASDTDDNDAGVRVFVITQASPTAIRVTVAYGTAAAVLTVTDGTDPIANAVVSLQSADGKTNLPCAVVADETCFVNGLKPATTYTVAVSVSGTDYQADPSTVATGTSGTVTTVDVTATEPSA